MLETTPRSSIVSDSHSNAISCPIPNLFLQLLWPTVYKRGRSFCGERQRWWIAFYYNTLSRVELAARLSPRRTKRVFFFFLSVCSVCRKRMLWKAFMMRRISRMDFKCRLSLMSSVRTTQNGSNKKFSELDGDASRRTSLLQECYSSSLSSSDW